MTSDSVANVSSIRLRRWLSDLIEGVENDFVFIDPLDRSSG